MPELGPNIDRFQNFLLLGFFVDQGVMPDRDWREHTAIAPV
jgi:hypothetical protein